MLQLFICLWPWASHITLMTFVFKTGKIVLYEGRLLSGLCVCVCVDLVKVSVEEWRYTLKDTSSYFCTLECITILLSLGLHCFVNSTTNMDSKPKPKLQLQISLLSLSVAAWSLQLWETFHFIAVLWWSSRFLSLCFSWLSLVFLCFSYPRHPQEDPKPLADDLISSML